MSQEKLKNKADKKRWKILEFFQKETRGYYKGIMFWMSEPLEVQKQCAKNQHTLEH